MKKPPSLTESASAKSLADHAERIERRRRVAIERSHHECEGRPKGKPCGFVASDIRQPLSAGWARMRLEGG